jgi:hypothetical protein
MDYNEAALKKSITVIGIDKYEENHEYIVELHIDRTSYREKYFIKNQPYVNLIFEDKNYPIHLLYSFPLGVYADKKSFFENLALTKQFNEINKIHGYPEDGLKIENILTGNTKTIPHTLLKNYDYVYDFKLSENFFKDCGTDYTILITDDVEVQKIINKNAKVFYEKDASCLPLLTSAPSCLTLGILPLVINTKKHAAIFVFNRDGKIIGSRYFEEKGYMFKSNLLIPFLYSDNVKVDIIGPEVEKQFEKEVELALYNKITDAIIEIINKNQ